MPFLALLLLFCTLPIRVTIRRTNNSKTLIRTLTRTKTMATLTVNPTDVLATPTVTASPSTKPKRRIRFNEDPVSDIFIVNRIADNLILTMFYQPEDFARFRYERELERMEMEGAARRRRMRQRDSMDLLRSNLSVPLAPRFQPTPAQAKIQRPSAVQTSIPCPVSPMRSLSPMRRPSGTGSGGGSISPMRPCSRGRPNRGPAGKGGKRPMALAA